MHSRNEVAVSCAQPKRVRPQDRCRSRSAMRCPHLRDDHGAPTGLVQTRGELDVFVIGEESRIEHPLAQGDATKQRRGCRYPPRLGKVRAERYTMTDLAKGAVADVDPGAVDGLIVFPD